MHIDRTAERCADQREAPTTVRIAAASPGFVVRERTVGDRGYCAIHQGPADRAADETKVGVAGVGGGVGTPDGLIRGEGTSRDDKDGRGGIKDGTARGEV